MSQFETVSVFGDGPIAGARVECAFDDTQRHTHVADENGAIRLDGIPTRLLAMPPYGYYPALHTGPVQSIGRVIQCRRLDDAESSSGWWHRAMGLRGGEVSRGAGIRIAVLDTGLEHHDYLTHVRSMGTFTDSGEIFEDDDGVPVFGADKSGHGTHVCGIIGARPAHPDEYAGVVPGADIQSLRVFNDLMTIDHDDLAELIEIVSEEVDLINLSLSIKPKPGGATPARELLQHAVDYAWEQGALCICSTGNYAAGEPRPVGIPAACDRAVAVTALGDVEVSASDSYTQTMMPNDEIEMRSGVYVGTFSGIGPEVTCCGPGIGIIAPAAMRPHDGACSVPDRPPYVAMSGTSMAAPMVTGWLALALANDDEYALLSGSEKSQRAMDILLSGCEPIAAPEECQGHGLPKWPSS